MSETLPVAIVGGGISGLGAAHALHKAGVPFRLYEAAPRLGGVIQTDLHEGFVLEGGPDTILAQKPEGLALAREFDLTDRMVGTNMEQRTLYILTGGRLKPMPEGLALAIPTKMWPFVRSDVFSWPGKIRMGLDAVIPPRRGEGDESIASFMRRRLGGEALRLLGEPLLAGIHAGDPEQLSITATFPRFVEMERNHGSLLRAMLAAKRAAPAAGASHGAPGGQGAHGGQGGNGRGPMAPFFSFKAGLGELVDALVARLPADALRTGRALESIARDESGWTLAFAGGESVRARALVLAIPAPKLVPLLQPHARDLVQLLETIPFVSSATVLIGYRREQVAHPLDGYGLVTVAGQRISTMALSFLSTKRPGSAPEGHVLLRGFLGGARDPDVLRMADHSLVAAVIGDMRSHLGLSGAPLFSRVYRWPQTTPQMTVGHFGRMEQIDRLTGTLPGLFLTGAGLRATGIPDCYGDAVKTAEAARAWLG
ncbi:MAG: protoporphyrinogen oxidase [Vicinamibacteria bacterium]|nr:protoporphyrinogen oxidase [Vicinamibacteria bacterium]